jgi:hypothetical protein
LKFNDLFDIITLKKKAIVLIAQNTRNNNAGENKMKAIVNGKIILKDRIVEGSALLYSNVIEGIVPADKLPEGVEVIDAKGGYVAPGLIDIHIHGYLGKDVCDGEEESIRTISKGLLANGVTGYLPTTMTVDMKVIKKALEVCRALKEESKTWEGSTILGVHAEGPFISAAKKGAQDPKYILKPDAKFVKEYADIIRIISLAPEEDENFEANTVGGWVTEKFGRIPSIGEVITIEDIEVKVVKATKQKILKVRVKKVEITEEETDKD